MRRAGRQPESLWIPYNDPYSLGFHAAQRSGGSCAISSLGDSWPFVLLSLFNTLVGNSLKCCFKATSCSRLIASERGRDVCVGLEIGACLSNRLPVWEGQRTSGTLLPQPCPCGGKGSRSTSHRHGEVGDFYPWYPNQWFWCSSPRVLLVLCISSSKIFL